MIDIQYAIDEFINYTNRYDMNQKDLLRKKEHSFRVMELSEYIAKTLNLSEEDINLAKIIGLLHDLGRFEQFKQFATYSDLNSFDHADYSVEVLNNNDYIRKFIIDNKYDYIIKKAIKNHNKFFIEQGLDEYTNLFAKLIRDADKIDIIREAVDIFYDTQEAKDRVENGKFTEAVFEAFKERKTIDKRLMTKPNDALLVELALAFDFNFEVSKELIKEKGYLLSIIHQFDFKNEDTKNKMQEVENIIVDYLNN